MVRRRKASGALTAYSPSRVDTTGDREAKPTPIQIVRERNDRSPLLTLPEQIAERLAANIVSQVLAPGQRLREMELAAQFGASRAPIREALRLLELRGLVQIRARRGVNVTQLSASEVDNLYEIRASLLGVAARRVALCRDDKFLRAANMLLKRLSDAVGDSDGGRYFEATYELSNLIAETSGNPRLFALISSFSQQVARYTRMSLQSATRRKQSIRNWRRLIKAIEDGAPELAEQVQKELVFGSRDCVRKILEQQSTVSNAGD
jgi:DNA-binding GntR family transcriptional regulator